MSPQGPIGDIPEGNGANTPAPTQGTRGDAPMMALAVVAVSAASAYGYAALGLLQTRALLCRSTTVTPLRDGNNQTPGSRQISMSRENGCHPSKEGAWKKGEMSQASEWASLCVKETRKPTLRDVKVRDQIL